MAMLLEKVYVIPTIESARTTYKGDQYTVLTPEYSDIVTVNGSHITCTSGESSCEHIRTVERHRTQNAQAAARRAAYCAMFDLSYGE
jgi:hypothetical protein